MTTEEQEAEAKRLEDRRAEIARMGDAYLGELARVTGDEHAMLVAELARRKAKRTTVIVELPCTLQDLETAIHSYGDHHGFRGKVVVVPASEEMCRNEGVGVEEESE